MDIYLVKSLLKLTLSNVKDFSFQKVNTLLPPGIPPLRPEAKWTVVDVTFSDIMSLFGVA